MYPYELVQLKKQREQQEQIIRSWFGDFAATSEVTITEPKQMQSICTLNPMAVALFEKAQRNHESVCLTFTKPYECMNQFVIKTPSTQLYL